MRGSTKRAFRLGRCDTNAVVQRNAQGRKAKDEHATSTAKDRSWQKGGKEFESKQRKYN